MSVYPNTDQDCHQLDTEIIICNADNIIGPWNLKSFVDNYKLKNTRGLYA